MKIEISSPKSIYVTIGNWTYYIDDSTGEKYVSIFESNKQDPKSPIKKKKPISKPIKKK